MKNNLIGRKVIITDKESIYYNFSGNIVMFDGDSYHVNGGSISTTEEPNVTPIFERNQFRVVRVNK